MTLEILFREWYSIVDPGFTTEKVAHRLTAISTIASSLTPSSAVELAAMFYSQDTSPTFTETIRTKVRDADNTYVSHERAELAIVCAGVLYSLFQKSSNLGFTAALLIQSGEFGGLQGASRVDAVVDHARQYLIEEGTNVREKALSFPNLGELLKPATKKLQAATKERAASEAEADLDTSFDIDTEILNSLKSFGTNLTLVLERLEKRRLEESSVLYWLLGSRVLESEEPFNKIDKPRLALLAASDLAVQTQHLPGPASCRAILKSVLAQGKGSLQQVSTESCISKLTALDGERLLKNAKASSPLFMPLTFALEKAHEVNWATGWENAFTAQTKMKATTNRPLEEVAEQFYREILLTRLLRGA